MRSFWDKTWDRAWDRTWDRPWDKTWDRTRANWDMGIVQELGYKCPDACPDKGAWPQIFSWDIGHGTAAGTPSQLLRVKNQMEEKKHSPTCGWLA